MDFGTFKKKRVLIMGLGLHGGGAGATAFFTRAGSRVTVTDLKTRRELAPSLSTLKRFRGIVYHLGGHQTSDFRNADFVVKNPGVPDTSKFLKIAKQSGARVLSDIEVFFALCPAPIIGVTGTKGKTTTTTLLAAFLKTHPSRPRVWLGGNMRTSPLEFLLKIRKGEKVVLELSSFQLDSLKQSHMSPHIAIMTNIFPDHLNRYPSLKAYITSKANIFAFQKKGDFLFVNAGDPNLRTISKKAPSHVLRIHARQTLRKLKDTLPKTIPPYHFPNIALAVAVAEHLGVRKRAIEKTLRAFRGIPGRMESVRTLGGIEFINDTTATNPGAAQEAVLATKRRINKGRLHVIAGGSEKKLPASEFAHTLAKNAETIVFLPGTATKEIELQVKSRASKTLTIYHAENMPQAVRLAYQRAKRGDAVLLSPGAASFGIFLHEFDRGDAFIRAVRSLRPRYRAQTSKI